MNARDKTSFTAALWEIRGLSDQPHRTHGFDAGCPICKGSPEEIASALAFAGMFDAAPAGDGGLREALGQAWDDGNAVGLDGYVGPGRGAGEVDPEAERARDRVLDKLAEHPAAPAVPQPIDREALERALREHKAFERMPMSNKQLDKDYADLADALAAVLAGSEVKP